MNAIDPLDCGALVTTVFDWSDVVMGVMPGSNGIMDMIGFLGVSLTSSVFSIVIFNSDDVWFWLSFLTHHVVVGSSPTYGGK